MEIIGPILISSIAGLSTVLGGLIIFLKIKKENINKFIPLALSFSFSVMIFISILDLIPSSSYKIINEIGLFKGVLIISVSFIIGIHSIKVINKQIDKHSSSSNLWKVGVLSMIALMIHNFPEGIATFMTSIKDINLGISLAIAIMMHNIPEGIAIAVPIYYATKKRGVALLVLSQYITDLLISIILINVSGIMISISINNLLPESLSYKKPKFIYLGLLLGIILSITNHFLFG